jgi:hypothetical protein
MDKHESLFIRLLQVCNPHINHDLTVERFFILREILWFQVHLCEAEGVPEYNGVSSFHKKQLVIVKSLWRGCGETTRCVHKVASAMRA